VVAGLSLFLSHFLSHVNINIAAFFSSFRLLCTATSIYFPEKNKYQRMFRNPDNYEVTIMAGLRLEKGDNHN
jgi:hypothetical protein